MPTLIDVLKPALRRGGVTILPGTTPSIDQTAELIAEVNRMLAAWSCDGHRIFTTSIDQYPLTAAQKVYTIGPGGNFDNPRPIYIKEANILYPTSPVLRRPVAILDDDEWSRIAIQDISGAPPWGLYYDGSLIAPDGLANIYLVPQPNAGYTLELYTWTALKADFSATSDAVLFPPGYEDAIVKNLALCVVALYPEQSSLNRNALAYSALQKAAALALDALITLNTQSPVLYSEAANLGGDCLGGDGNYYGIVAGGGNGGGVPIGYSSAQGTVTGTIDGANTLFFIPATPSLTFIYLNGLLMNQPTDVIFLTNRLTFQAGHIPPSGSVITVVGYS